MKISKSLFASSTMHFQYCRKSRVCWLFCNENSNDHWYAQRIFQSDYILISLYSDVGWKRTDQSSSMIGQCWTDNRTARGHSLILIIFWLRMLFTKVQNSKTVIPAIYHVLKVNWFASTSSGWCTLTLYHITGRHLIPDGKLRPTRFRKTFILYNTSENEALQYK
jgi:hypothetical protein